MSAFPVVVEGSAISALVVGAGRVATRRVIALLDAGARVTVIAREVSDELRELAGREERLVVEVGDYRAAYVGDATLIIAATNDADVNARVAEDARERGRLVNVADAPQRGNCTTPAAYRCGELVVAVSAAGVPTAAVRIRDAIEARFGPRYAIAVHELARLRRRLLDSGDREHWHEAVAELVARDFCESVETGEFAKRMDRWA